MTEKQRILWEYMQKDAAFGAAAITGAKKAGGALAKLPGQIVEGAGKVGQPVVKGATDLSLWVLKSLIVPMLLLGPPAAGALAGVTHSKLTSPTKESEQAKLREIESKELGRTLAAVRRKQQLAQQKRTPDVGKKPLYI